MTSRVCATLAILSLWLVFYFTLEGSLPTLLRYLHDLQGNHLAAYVMRVTMEEHMNLPATVSFMALAVLWAPVIVDKLESKHAR
jgi:hypothetical protein